MNTPQQDLNCAKAEIYRLREQLTAVHAILGSTLFDIGHLPMRFMREEPAARALFADYEKLSTWVAQTADLCLPAD